MLASSDKYLLLLISVPTNVIPGNYSCTVGPSTLSDICSPELAVAIFDFTVEPARPYILIANPSQAAATGGETVILLLSGFPTPFNLTSVHVYFGAAAAMLQTNPNGGFGDAPLISLSVLAPAGTGFSSIKVKYAFTAFKMESATLSASLPFLFISDLITCTCITRCVLG